MYAYHENIAGNSLVNEVIRAIEKVKEYEM